ncbi:NAD-dependent protein deacetylase hst2-1 [Venturia inaequalis]|nr:NAD-dependent protein deacetylase hst2-1 [Venturia inaequalis]
MSTYRCYYVAIKYLKSFKERFISNSIHSNSSERPVAKEVWKLF